jgi:hypothetical protein
MIRMSITTTVLALVLLAAGAPGFGPAPARPDHEAMRQDPGMRAAMGLVVQLLADPHVQHRIHAVPEFHEVWEDEGVQRHFDMMRRMHGPEPHEH